MLVLRKVKRPSRCQCVACDEYIKHSQQHYRVFTVLGKQVPSERYCLTCEDIAYDNNDELVTVAEENEQDERDDERDLRRREE